MDHQEKHHQQHQKEREHEKQEQKEHERAWMKNPLPFHSAWLVAVVFALILAAVLIWTLLPW